jgi:hypothetical protein
MDRHRLVPAALVALAALPALQAQTQPASEALAAARAKAGIPFYVTLDAKGAPRSSSIRPLTPGAPAENLGYPGSTEEIKAFLAFLKEGAPSLTEAETTILARELDASRPKK